MSRPSGRVGAKRHLTPVGVLGCDSAPNPEDLGMRCSQTIVGEDDNKSTFRALCVRGTGAGEGKGASPASQYRY